MAITTVGGAINSTAVLPNLDYKYGPYSSKQEAYNTLGPNGVDKLAIGLTVGIIEEGKIREYWFRNDISSVDDLVLKSEGPSAYDIAVEEGYEGTKQKWIASLKGDKGDAAINPFKGWFVSAASLPSHPSVGDFAYVKGNDAVAIYECTEAGSWSGSGKTFNPEYEQSFASSEELQDVHIVNDTETGGEHDVLSAEQGKKLGQVVHDVNEALTDYVIGEALVPTATLTDSIIRGTTLEETGIDAKEDFRVWKFNVTPGNLYAMSAKESTGSNFYVVHWLDSNDNYIGRAYQGIYGEIDKWVDTIVVAPDEATQMWMNVEDYRLSSYAFKEVVSNDYYDLEEIREQLDANTANIANIAGMSETLDDVVDNVLTDYVIGEALVPTATLTDSIIRGTTLEETDIEAKEGFSIRKYNVTPGNLYAISAKENTTSNFYVVHWLDSNDNYIGRAYQGIYGEIDEWVDTIVVAPSGASQMWMNVLDYISLSFAFKEVVSSDYFDIGEINEKVDANTENIAEISETLGDVVAHITNEEYTLLYPYEKLYGHFINGHGLNKENTNMSIWKYSVNARGKYTFSMVYPESVNCDALIWLDSESTILLQQYRGRTDSIDVWNNEPVIAPDGATQLWANVYNRYASEHNVKSVYDVYYDFPEWERKLDEVRIGGSLMKVVVAGNRMPSESELFYVRTRYNDSKDIIIKHKVNKNGLVTFDKTYIGDNGLTDSALMVPANLMSDHQDSTGPLMYVTQYWHLFAQHGYVIPYISNTVGMNENDVGAEWKDQDNREYTIGKVTGEKIYLLPKIYEDAEGHNVRDWHSKSTGDQIVSLSHVDGGSYDVSFNVTGYNQVQLYPLMEMSDRKFMVDGVEIDGPGTYYCNDFSVSESQVGYDPATVTDTNWFSGDEDDEVNLEGAEVMAKFTWSYNYKGAQCCINTTVDIRREVELGCYGAIQQQFFYDQGDYKAMFMIPKAKARGGVEIDKPFNSPDANAQNYAFYRHENHLKDVNDPIDRMIGTLHNPTTGNYKFGMAAGLSLVSGDTVRQKRIQNCMIGSYDSHYIIGILSPSLTNKFYIAGFNTSAFADNGYYLPDTYFKEINFYVSYFDPNENVGQVYWYKDGNQYVIYCHCQAAVAKTPINVPLLMEGLSLDIVEKTDGATLLTDKIQNGKFFVSYNNNANYIVLKTL